MKTSKQSVEEIFGQIDSIDINSIELHPDAIKYLDTLQSYLQCFDQMEELYNQVDPKQTLANHNLPDVNLAIQQLSVKSVPVQNLVELYQVAEIVFPIFATKIEKLIGEARKRTDPRECGIQLRLPSGKTKLKGKQRALEKAYDDYSKKEPGPPESWLNDIVRGSVTFDRAEELLRFLELVCLDDSIEIVKSKNRFRNPTLSGYRDWNLQLQITADDGIKHICELQLHHKAIEEADTKIGSHKFYEFFRKFYAGATGTLQGRINDLRMISTGGSLNMSYLKEVIASPLETDHMKMLADLFENHINDYQLAMVITNAIRDQFEPAELYSRMGTLFWRQVKMKEATVMYEEALRIQLQVNGPDHIATAQAYNNKANVLYSQGQLEQAMNMHRRALYNQLKVFGPDHANTTTTYNNMAIILRIQGKLEEALALYQETLDIRLRSIGKFHTRTANTYSNMANVLQSLSQKATNKREKKGKLEESLELHHKALEIRLRILGTEHHSIANTYFTMGSVKQDQGLLEEALALYQRALVIRLKVFGSDHADTAETYDTIAIVLRKQGKLQEAMALYQKALEIRLKANHRCATISCNEIIAILRRQRKENSGEPLVRLATFSLTEHTRLHILGGSIVDYSRGVFRPQGTENVDGDSPTRPAAIVNCTNKRCLGGGPVDSAINQAGGESLIRDRRSIALLPNSNARCQTGKAVVTGPNNYGNLQVPYVIHAVGPDYSRWNPDIPNVDETGQTIHPFHEPDRLLKSAFSNALEIAREIGISELAFALISAGGNRGGRSLEDILSISIDGICEWVEDNIPLSTDLPHTIAVEDISLVAFSFAEMQALLDVCRDRFDEKFCPPVVYPSRVSLFETKDNNLHCPISTMVEEPVGKRSVADILMQIDHVDVSKLERDPKASKHVETLQSHLKCFDQLEVLYNIFDSSQKLANYYISYISLPIQQLSLHGEPVKNLMEVYEVAEIILPVFVAKIKELIQVWKSFDPTDCDIHFELPPGDNKLKSKHRALEKANEDYSQKEPGPPESWLCDIVRGSVVFGNAEQLLRFLELVRQDTLIQIVKSTNHFCNPTLSGYRDWNLKLRITTSKGRTKHTCELQLHHRAIKEADAKLGSYKFYEFLREYYADATNTGSLNQRRDDLGMILNGSSLDMESLEKVVEKPVETDRMKRLATLFEHQLNNYQLAIVMTNATRSILEPTELYSRLGNLFMKQGNFEKAMAMFEKDLEIMLSWKSKQALQIFKKDIGEDHPTLSSSYQKMGVLHIAKTYSNMAKVQHSQGCYTKALMLHQMSLKSRLEAVGPEHHLTASTYHDMACVLQSQSRLEGAMTLYQRALAVWLKTVGPDYSDSIQIYTSMAAVQNSLGQYNKGLELYSKALEIQLKVFGPDHDATAQIYSNIATVLRRSNQNEEAIRMYQTSLEIRLNDRWKHRSNTTAISFEIVGLLARQQKLSGATPLARLMTYAISRKARLHILGGSVIDYSPGIFRPHDNIGESSVLRDSCTELKTRRAVAIVNATNEACLGGCGLDAAINKAGGLSMIKDRYNLKVLLDGRTRCQTGSAVLTGPNNYGNLHVPNVIHTVGPIYWEWDRKMPNRSNEGSDVMNPFQAADHLLKSAYTSSLQVAKEHGISELAFSLICAGLNRGERSLEDVLSIAVAGICDWVQDNTAVATNSRNSVVVEDISLVAYTIEEMRTLLDVCQRHFSAPEESYRPAADLKLDSRKPSEFLNETDMT
ncbi:unnamed protein product [Cylindrotheca closterium]|uniref:Macro domain-containing protein n=1 Tax=Cylindrotheca closterium TaxID=2856 RepID=A0AAD2FW31_9STRA|nr:unnamed protein product [Cylindrotheca closterium]